MKIFIKRLLIYIALMAIMVVIINNLYISNSVNFGTMGSEKNDSAYIKDVPEQIQICNFGNSHGYYGFNYDNFEDEYVCYNFSLSGQSMSYNYRILENYKDRIKPEAKIYICISYNSFFGEKEENSKGFASKNKRYYHFLEKEFIKEYDSKTDFYVNYFPALTETDMVSLTKAVLGVNDSLTKDFWSQKTDKKKAKEHGWPRVISVVRSTLDQNGNRLINEEEIEALYEMIEMCYEIDAIPILIVTPFLHEYTFSVSENDPNIIGDYQNIIAEIQNNTGVAFYDYSEDVRFAEEYDLFINTDHMNREGAKRFTDILLEDTLY